MALAPGPNPLCFTLRYSPPVFPAPNLYAVRWADALLCESGHLSHFFLHSSKNPSTPKIYTQPVSLFCFPSLHLLKPYVTIFWWLKSTRRDSIQRKIDKRIGKLQRKANWIFFLIPLYTSAPYIFISFPLLQSQQFLDQIDMLAFRRLKLSPLIKREKLPAHFKSLAHCSIWLNAWSKWSRARISFSISNKLIKRFTFPENLVVNSA